MSNKKVPGKKQLSRAAYRESTGIKYSPYTKIERGNETFRSGETSPSDLVSYDKAASESNAAKKSISRQSKINADQAKRKQARIDLEKKQKQSASNSGFIKKRY